MPGIRTAGWLVARVREDTGRHDTDSFANGYVSEGATTGRVSILAKINETLTFLLQTGFAAKYYNLAINNGGYDYSLPSLHLSEIYSVSISGRRLVKSTIPGLDSSDPLWRTRIGTNPSKYARYANRISFNTTPGTNLTAVILANSSEDVPDLAEAVDSPAILPARFQDGLHYGASIDVLIADGENPVSSDRIQGLAGKWSAYLSDLTEYIHQELGYDEIPPVTLDDYYSRLLTGDRIMVERKD